MEEDEQPKPTACIGNELVRCRCRSRFCSHCALVEGLGTAERVKKVIATFKHTLLLTFTVDPKLFASQKDAYAYVQMKRCIGEWIRSMDKAGHLHSRRYFCVVEWQMGKGEKEGTLMAHYHVLVDASFIPWQDGLDRWSKFRPEEAGPVDCQRPPFGTFDIKKKDFKNSDHAAGYACKYLLKQPEKGFPDWVLDSHGEIKRYWTSKGFYGEDAAPIDLTDEGDLVNAIQCAETETEPDEAESDVKKLETTIRERVARCGHGIALLLCVPTAQPANREAIKRVYMERYEGIDLEEACGHLGIELAPGSRRVRLTFSEANELLKWAAWRSGWIPHVDYDPFKEYKKKGRRKVQEVQHG